MVFRTTQALGLQLSDVSSGLPYWDNNGITEASYRLGDKELGSDGGEYWFVKASADIASTATTGTQVAVTFPAWTVATGTDGYYTPPATAVKAGDYFHIRKGAYNATPTT
jgi:hypothetical protein